MNRRGFIGVSALGAIGLISESNNVIAFSSQEKKNRIKPKKLKEGDNIAVIAPATNVSDPDDIRRAVEVLAYFGLNPIISKSLTEGVGFRTKDRQIRANDIETYFKDESISGIFCIRGGYGSGDILDLINYDLIKENPKVFIGYSDITALHLAIQKYTNLITFHGPVLLSGFSNYTAESFKKTLFETESIGLLRNPQGKSGIREAFPTRTIVAGKAKGELIGGNLSLICSLMGTPYEIDTKGKILFLEDVGEEPYRIDRMLTQLRLAGKLKDSAGIVFGTCSDCGIKSAPPAFDHALGDVLNRHFKELICPSFFGLMIGHTNDQLTLPVGLEADIDSTAGTLRINESAVL